jgi:hypothetical protein
MILCHCFLWETISRKKCGCHIPELCGNIFLTTMWEWTIFVLFILFPNWILLLWLSGVGCWIVNFDDDSHVLDDPVLKLLFVFLRYISGWHWSVHRYTLLLGFTPYQVQCARLCARYWNKAREDDGLSGIHLKSTLLLFQRGNFTCWTAKFLKCINKLGLGPPGYFVGLWSLDHEVLLAPEYNEDIVEEALLSRYKAMFWTLDLDPRTAPSRMANLNRYRQWFIAKGRLDFMQRHLAEALPSHVHRNIFAVSTELNRS